MIKLKILALLCSIIFASSLFADDHNEEHEKHKESHKHHFYKNLDYLNLDKQQLNNLKEVLINYKKEYKKFYKFKAKKEKELAKFIKEENFDELSYKKILNEINTKAEKIELANLKKIHTILNKKQREEFSYFLQEWRVE
jgi:Spy/CpxP family protein refolding chaperone